MILIFCPRLVAFMNEPSLKVLKLEIGNTFPLILHFTCEAAAAKKCTVLLRDGDTVLSRETTVKK